MGRCDRNFDFPGTDDSAPRPLCTMALQQMYRKAAPDGGRRTAPDPDPFWVAQLQGPWWNSHGDLETLRLPPDAVVTLAFLSPGEPASDVVAATLGSAPSELPLLVVPLTEAGPPHPSHAWTLPAADRRGRDWAMWLGVQGTPTVVVLRVANGSWSFAPGMGDITNVNSQAVRRMETTSRVGAEAQRRLDDLEDCDQ